MREPEPVSLAEWQAHNRQIAGLIRELLDDVHLLQARVDKLDEVLKMLLAHQGELDSHLNDIVKARNWWKRDPPIPVQAYPDDATQKKLIVLVEKLTKAGLL